MPTICDFLIASSISQVTLLVACKMNLFSKQKIQEVEHKKIGNEKEEMVIEQYNKMSVTRAIFRKCDRLASLESGHKIFIQIEWSFGYVRQRNVRGNSPSQKHNGITLPELECGERICIKHILQGKVHQ